MTDLFYSFGHLSIPVRWRSARYPTFWDSTGLEVSTSTWPRSTSSGCASGEVPRYNNFRRLFHLNLATFDE